MSYIDVLGKTEEEAISKALAQLGMERDDVSVTILERAKSGFLGFGSSPARVRVTYGPDEAALDEPVPAPASKPQPKAVENKPAPAPAARPAAKSERTPAAKQPVRLTEKPIEKSTEKPAEKPVERPAEKPVPKVQAAPATAEKSVDLPESEDENAARIRTFLTGLLVHLGSEAQVKVYEAEKGRYKVILEGDKLGQLIGRRGETLDAIQQLTGYAVNDRGNARVRVQVDAENYRAKREASLESLANKVAAKVTKYRRSVTLEPMNAYERHVIHAALQGMPHISTFSIGSEPNRRVVVSYEK